MQCPHHSYEASLENPDQSLHRISDFESTVLESKERNLHQVLKMRIHNKNNTNTFTGRSQSQEFKMRELRINICSDKKEIMYPIIDHNQMNQIHSNS